jgi:hypothetical protein
MLKLRSARSRIRHAIDARIPPPRRVTPAGVVAPYAAGGAHVIGTFALGAVAVGALAVGAMAIGRLAIGRARIRRLEIDELVVRRLHVVDELNARAPSSSDGSTPEVTR